MKKTVYIEGMMCVRCAARARKALAAVAGVAEAEVLLESGCAIVTLDAPVSDTALMDAVSAAGYTPLRVE